MLAPRLPCMFDNFKCDKEKKIDGNQEKKVKRKNKTNQILCVMLSHPYSHSVSTATCC